MRARVDAGAAGVLVTHEARHAAWADRVVFLRDGRMVDDTGFAPPAEALLEARADERAGSPCCASRAATPGGRRAAAR